MTNLTTTLYVVDGFTSYHTDRTCKALDSAQIHGAIHPADPDDVAAASRPACIVCASDPGATEWVLTAANLGQLWELIDPSKPHVEWPEGSTRAVTTGLTIREHEGQPQQVAYIGDTIRLDQGQYIVHTAKES